MGANQLSSTPAYQSPLRHHRRHPSQQRTIKETLNAKSEYTNNEEDGKAEHRINQYIIKDEIGRGSFGAVHLAVDQYGTEYVSRLHHGRSQGNVLLIMRALGGQRVLKIEVTETSSVEYPKKTSCRSKARALACRCWAEFAFAPSLSFRYT